jgi:hypothetical protein
MIEGANGVPVPVAGAARAARDLAWGRPSIEREIPGGPPNIPHRSLCRRAVREATPGHGRCTTVGIVALHAPPEVSSRYMEASMTTRLSITAVLMALAVSAGVMRFGFSVASASQQGPAAQATAQPSQSGMQNMMKMHEQMMAAMKADDAKLDALVKDMNVATGDAKVKAMAAVVHELVQQHKAMHGRMGEMHQKMMGEHGR